MQDTPSLPRTGALAVALLTAALLCPAGTSAQQEPSEKTSMAVEMAAAPEPGREMEKLKILLGSWKYTEAYEKTPLFPDGAPLQLMLTTKAARQAALAHATNSPANRSKP